MPARLHDAYPTPLRAGVSLLWLAGALLALVTTLLALAHATGPAVAAYPLVAAVLIALAVPTWLRAWWGARCELRRHRRPGVHHARG